MFLVCIPIVSPIDSQAAARARPAVSSPLLLLLAEIDKEIPPPLTLVLLLLLISSILRKDASWSPPAMAVSNAPFVEPKSEGNIVKDSLGLDFESGNTGGRG